MSCPPAAARLRSPGVVTVAQRREQGPAPRQTRRAAAVDASRHNRSIVPGPDTLFDEETPMNGKPAVKRTALVTGGTRGIGAAISESLARAGYNVAIGYSSRQAPAEELAGRLSEFATVSIHRGNVGDPEDCRRVVDEVAERHGTVDVLVNNAGVTVDKTVRKMSIEDWHAVMRVNLSGNFYMTKMVLDGMVERGFGRIVNISSLIGQTGAVGQANYAASKSGIFGFTKSLALEVALKGITVNCVAPGAIDTEMLAAVPEPMREKMLEKIPVRRLGRPQDIARAVLFLADDAADYITGQVISVNGGWDM
jgi:NAD(P)-dependent dehydrogenase (short-subunit alcohol dehydrogenase family)